MVSTVPSDTLPETDADANRLKTTASSSLNGLFRACSDQMRRETLVVLRTKNGPISLSELARTIDEDTEQARMSLVHVHLPMLDALGLVHWNRERESVEFATVPREFRGLLATIERER
ncbi:DUF7344 domain-containing protein [Haladaptatus cibarius]|uniref:DUF7344 domain-containing protein n=1 Tax=Haladaptatus cibarius TaxID=453847 RepID=UPI000678B7DF|nr:hypothetical protein [Haladaptatus cibarius]